jgi:hypothetical protein
VLTATPQTRTTVERLPDSIYSGTIIKQVDVRLKGERGGRVPKSSLNGTDISGSRCDDRAMRVTQHVESDGRNAGSRTGGSKNTSAEVRLIDSAAIVGGEDQGVSARLPLAETMRFELSCELGSDRDASRATFALRLKLAVEKPVSSPN